MEDNWLANIEPIREAGHRWYTVTPVVMIQEENWARPPTICVAFCVCASHWLDPVRRPPTVTWSDPTPTWDSHKAWISGFKWSRFHTWALITAGNSCLLDGVCIEISKHVSCVYWSQFIRLKGWKTEEQQKMNMMPWKVRTCLLKAKQWRVAMRRMIRAKEQLSFLFAGDFVVIQLNVRHHFLLQQTTVLQWFYDNQV